MDLRGVTSRTGLAERNEWIFAPYPNFKLRNISGLITYSFPIAEISLLYIIYFTGNLEHF